MKLLPWLVLALFAWLVMKPKKSDTKPMDEYRASKAAEQLRAQAGLPSTRDRFA